MQQVGIWAFGLFAGGVTGGLIGERFNADHGAAMGALVGIVLFACFRLFVIPAKAE